MQVSQVHPVFVLSLPVELRLGRLSRLPDLVVLDSVSCHCSLHGSGMNLILELRLKSPSSIVAGCITLKTMILGETKISCPILPA